MQSKAGILMNGAGLILAMHIDLFSRRNGSRMPLFFLCAGAVWLIGVVSFYLLLCTPAKSAVMMPIVIFLRVGCDYLEGVCRSPLADNSQSDHYRAGSLWFAWLHRSETINFDVRPTEPARIALGGFRPSAIESRKLIFVFSSETQKRYSVTQSEWQKEKEPEDTTERICDGCAS